MALESATYVQDLVTTNPPTTDKRHQGDDHLRLIKTTLDNTFPSGTRALYIDTAEVTVASDATCNILDAASDHVHISGTTTITSLGTGANRRKVVRFSDALLLTHNSTSLILPTGANITTAAGDTMIVVADASSNARVVAYMRASGAALLSYLLLSGGTMSGELVMADQLLTRPKLKDYSEVVSAHGGSGGGTEDFDLTVANVHSVTVDTSANTFTFSNPAASGTACWLTLIITNGGSQTVNWPASVDWEGGTAPTLTAAGVDIISFLTVDAGTTWHGFVGSLDSK